jgi:anionic cell wall polymer biosynthesis LytR-Cps2A-Psr (LCP) family protein
LRLSKTDASRILLGIIIFLFVFAFSFAVYTFRTNPIQDALSGNRVINTLFVIEDNKKPVSSYVLMYYPHTRRAAIFDVPGDLGQLLSRVNRVDRIDRVYDPARINVFGNEIEKLLEINLNFYIVITKENLVSIVDLLEGVRIFIPSSVSYREGDELILFPYGMTVLDGDKASVYATYSLPDEDRNAEAARRQPFFLGLLKRHIQMNERLKNPDAAKYYYSFFRSGMNHRTLRLLFDEFTNIDIDRTSIRPVEGNLREVSGEMLVIPLLEGSLVKEIAHQTTVALTREIDNNDQGLTVEVLNGTAVTGRAGRTADILRSFGYDIISISNADRNNYERTTIIHRSGSETLVRQLAGTIRCNDIISETDMLAEGQEGAASQTTELKADVTLIIGRNFDGRYVVGD